MPLIKEHDWKALPESAQQEVYDFFLFIKQRYAKQTDQEKAETIAFSNHSENTIDEWLDDKEDQARHATSRNSGTPVAVIRSPTQRIGDAPAALRPPQTEHKAAQSWLPQMALRLFGIKF